MYLKIAFFKRDCDGSLMIISENLLGTGDAWVRILATPEGNDMFSSIRNHFCCPCKILYELNYWGRVTHICVSKLTIVGPDNDLSPARRQAIICTNAGILLIRTLGTNLTEIDIFSFAKMHLKISSAKWRQFCLGLNVSKDKYYIAEWWMSPVHRVKMPLASVVQIWKPVCWRPPARQMWMLSWWSLWSKFDKNLVRCHYWDSYLCALSEVKSLQLNWRNVWVICFTLT